MAAALLAATASAGEHDQHGNSGQGELVFFPFVDAETFDSDDPIYDTSELDLSVDVLGSWGAGRIRVLGELLLSTEEQDLERFQVGWEALPNTYLWLGRFHQPASVWNTRHHHGPYLQSSITRPAIELWEDEGGVLPQHLVGLLAETRRPMGETGGVSLAAGIGVGPALKTGSLEPLEAFEFHNFENRRSWSLRANWLPDFTGDDGIGLIASHSQIDIREANYPGPADRVDLDVAGLFVAWTHDPWRLDAALYAMRADFVGEGSADDNFTAGYLQLRRELGKKFSILGRFEDSADTSESRYLALFSDFTSQRTVLDFRWDFMRQQAITVEVATSQARDSDFRELRLQWSAALP
ncbi:MAG: hypothetical protein ACRER4_00045 [Steroidobacteraceae bacterium]